MTFAFAGDSTMSSGMPCVDAVLDDFVDGDAGVDASVVDGVRDVRVDFMGASSTHTSQKHSVVVHLKPLQTLRKRKT